MQRASGSSRGFNDSHEPKVVHYLAVAHQMRSQVMMSGLRRLQARLRLVLDRCRTSDHGRGAPPAQLVQSGWPWVDLIMRGTPAGKTGRA
jgi:hypothetical protein